MKCLVCGMNEMDCYCEDPGECPDPRRCPIFHDRRQYYRDEQYDASRKGETPC